jgi:hypothetical protein
MDWVTVNFTEAQAANGNSGLGFVNGDSPLHRGILYALAVAAAQIDMRNFDIDGDGLLDGLTVIHSGYGASDKYLHSLT